MKKVIFIFLVSTLLVSCNNGADSKMNGKWRTEKEFRGVPNEIVTVDIKGESVTVKIDPAGRRSYGGFGDHSIKNFTGKRTNENNFELGNGITLDYNEDLDRLYLKSQWGGQEYTRYK